MGALRRLRFVAAQIGARPRGSDPRAMLLTVDDLPGEGWRVIDERTWRTGSTGQSSDWARRAREAKSVTAWRSFEQRGEQRWLWCEVIPLASPEDAVAVLSSIPEITLRNLRAKVRPVEQREMTVTPPPGSEHVWAREDLAAVYAGNAVRLLGLQAGDR